MDDTELDVTDDKNQIVGKAGFSEIHRKGLWHRSAQVLIINDKEEILFQKRRKDAYIHPDSWMCSAAGHVDKGESYQDAAEREMYEEIGIKTPIIKIGDYTEIFQENGIFNRSFNQVFAGFHNGPFEIDKDEAVYVKFMSVEEMQNIIDTDPRVCNPCLTGTFKIYLDWKNKNKG